MNLEFGIFTRPAFRPTTNWTKKFDSLVDVAVLAESLGFAEFWHGEHHNTGHETGPMPEMQLARIAEVTDTIRLGPATVNLSYPIHDPYSVANRMAFLDQISHGRALYGYGTGGPSGGELVGWDKESAKDRMWEAIDIIETLNQAEEPTSFDGEFFQYDDILLQLPPLQENPPKALAGLTSESSFENAVRNSYRPLTLPESFLRAENNPVALSMYEIADVLDRTAEEVGRRRSDVHDDWTVICQVWVDDSKEAAMEKIREGVAEWFEFQTNLSDGAIKMLRPDQNMTREDLTPEVYAEHLPIILGSPEECIRQIKTLYEEVGGFGTLVIEHQDWKLPEREWRAMYERFAEEVMPAFQPRRGPREHNKRNVPSYEPIEAGDPEEVFQIDG
jgi:limonene 1,2-monooxygenase